MSGTQQETGATDTVEHLVEAGMPSCSAPPPDASIKVMLSMYVSWPKQKDFCEIHSYAL